MKPAATNILTALLLAAATAAPGGCLQIDLRVKLHTDGSATVTERLRFSRRLLDLGGRQDPKLRLAPLLERPAVLERMKHMGAGMKLESHRVADAEKGARESVAVFRVADVRELRYVSPFLCYADYAENNVLQVQMRPLYKSRNYVGTAGEMELAFRLLKQPKSHARPAKDAPPPKGPSPQQLQVLRDLQPMFRDMLRDFKLRLTFECYAPISATGFGWRDHRANTNIVDLIHVTDHDLDVYGSNFFENEEIMLDLLRGQYGSPNVVETVRHFQDNKTVPLHLPFGSAHRWWHPNDGIFFRPSRELFDRHFRGKKLDYSRWRASPPDKHVPASFENIGFHPDKHKIGTQTESQDEQRPGDGKEKAPRP